MANAYKFFYSFSESWRMKTFKTYNFNAYGLLPNSGHLHPLMKVHYEFRQIFFQMGFSEMPTNRYFFRHVLYFF